MVVLHLTDGKLCRNRAILSQWVQALSSEADLFVSDGSLEARSTLQCSESQGLSYRSLLQKDPEANICVSGFCFLASPSSRTERKKKKTQETRK